MTNIPTSDAVSSTAVSTESWVAAIIKGLLDGLDDAGPVVRSKLDAILREEDLVVNHKIEYGGTVATEGPLGKVREFPVKVSITGKHIFSFGMEKHA